jgi:hypothetical protein
VKIPFSRNTTRENGIVLPRSIDDTTTTYQRNAIPKQPLKHTSNRNCSFENLAIRNGFPQHRFIPRPRITQKLLVRLRGGVEFLEIVGLPVGGNVKGDLVVIAAGEEDAGDGAVVVLAEDEETAEEEFAGGFEAGEEAGDQV